MAPGLLADAGILATSGMHKHKSAPIVALPRLGPHPRNGRPSALEVILRRPQEPPPPKPLTPLVRTLWLLPAHAAAQQRLPASRVHRPARPLTLHRPHTVNSNGSRRPALAPAPCTCAIDRVGTADVAATTRTHRVCCPLLVKRRTLPPQALTKFRIRRPLINRADLCYQVCGNGT